MDSTQTILYLYTGTNYRFVGFQEGEKITGFVPGKNFYVKISQFTRDYWNRHPGIGQLFYSEAGNQRNFRLEVSTSPKEFAEGLMTLFKLNVKILLPKDCVVFKAEERRELERSGFVMAYVVVDGVVHEFAQYTLETMRGWATFFANLATMRGIASTIAPMSVHPVFASPLFERVEWKVSVTNLEDARAIRIWTAEAEEDSQLYFAAVEWGYQSDSNRPRPLIAKIPRGDRLLVCFLESGNLKLKSLRAEEVAGTYWKIRVRLPDNGQRAGRFQLIERFQFASAQ